MRLELHDAALAPDYGREKEKEAAVKVQRSGLSGRLRGALSSLSSGSLKARLRDAGSISR